MARRLPAGWSASPVKPASNSRWECSRKPAKRPASPASKRACRLGYQRAAMVGVVWSLNQKRHQGESGIHVILRRLWLKQLLQRSGVMTAGPPS
jgi:hypothetical protein